MRGSRLELRQILRAISMEDYNEVILKAPSMEQEFQHQGKGSIAGISTSQRGGNKRLKEELVVAETKEELKKEKEPQRFGH